MTPRIILTLVLLLSVRHLPRCSADDDLVREINGLIREVAQRQDDNELDENRPVYRQALQMLRKARRLRKEMGRLEEQAERAEEQGDDVEAEELWEDVERNELQIEGLMATLELIRREN